MSDQRLPLATPDFDSIKASLKQYLETRPELRDYNFEGSVLSVVLDTLAYNSHMNAFYLNMVGNENFLSTAVRRNSVVNNAKDLGYTPRTAISAKAKLDLKFSPNGTPANAIVIPKGFIFGSASGSVVHIFNTIDDYVANYDSISGKYVITGLPIYEGRRFTHTFQVSANRGIDLVTDVTIDGCPIPNIGIDSTTMKVFVNVPSEGSEFVQYTLYDNSLVIDGNSRTYFLRENENELTTVSFGDGVLGKKPPIGAFIRIEYVVSSGSKANGVKVFQAGQVIPGVTLEYLNVASVASGGTERESIESIKFNAVNSFESMGRGVTEDDYAFLAKKAYPSAKAVIAWGGQKNDPPENGKVFVSIQPAVGVAIAAEDKASVEEYLTRAGVVTVSPQIVDPDFVFVDTTTNFTYSSTSSTRLGGELETAIRTTISNYNDVNLNTFKSVLRYSNLLSAIDGTDNGIVSNITSFVLSKRFYARVGVPSRAELRFSNPLVRGSVVSTTFKYGTFSTCSFKSGAGNNLSIVNTVGGKDTVIVSHAGEIDYDNGVINVDPVTIAAADARYFDDLLQSPYIRISGCPVDSNVNVSRNQIITIEYITVNGRSV